MLCSTSYGCSGCLKTGPRDEKFQKAYKTQSPVAPLVCAWSAPLPFVYIAIGLRLVCAWSVVGLRNYPVYTAIGLRLVCAWYAVGLRHYPIVHCH